MSERIRRAGRSQQASALHQQQYQTTREQTDRAWFRHAGGFVREIQIVDQHAAATEIKRREIQLRNRSAHKGDELMIPIGRAVFVATAPTIGRDAAQ